MNETQSNRRKHDSVTSEIKEFVHDEFVCHEEREAAMIVVEMEKILRAFPGGADGIDYHNKYHEAAMKAAQAQEEYWKLAKEKLIEHGVSAFLTAVKGAALLILAGFLFKLGYLDLAAKVIAK